jgi:hypothetical protein
MALDDLLATGACQNSRRLSSFCQTHTFFRRNCRSDDDFVLFKIESHGVDR